MFRNLLDSQLKARLAQFFNENPGLVEDLDGLARRMGANREALSQAIADHVEVGMLKRLQANGTTLFMLNRERRREFERLLLVATQERLWEAL